jgi:hypothetical protein
MKFFLSTSLYIVAASTIACSSSKEITKNCYKNTKTIVSSYKMGKVTDDYFKLNKGNYFQYSRRLMGLTKIEEYNGTYTLINDTLVLSFCNNSIPDGLTGKGRFDKSGKSITLYTYSVTDQNFIIRKDRR